MPPGKQGFTLERDSRLSHSLLWGWARLFYETNGIRAWTEGTLPTLTATNCCVARKYAKVVLGLLNDMAAIAGADDDDSQQLLIVELGAGHGKFAFLVITLLLEMRAHFPEPRGRASNHHSPRSSDHRSPPPPPFKYIVTDLSPECVAFWKQHPKFQDLIDKGYVDFAVLDLEESGPINLDLECSGEVISPDTNTRPIFVIANQVFSTLQQDAFQVQAGVLKEALVSLHSSKPHEPDTCDPGLLRRCKPSWAYKATSSASYYSGSQAGMNVVLENVLRRPAMQTSSFTVPVGAMHTMRRLQQLANGRRLVLLAGDQAQSSESEMAGLRDPQVQVQDCLSVAVNLEALRVYIESIGAAGFTAQTPHKEGFKVALFCPGSSRAELRHTRFAFRDSLVTFDPHTFEMLQQSAKAEVARPSLQHAVALLRLSDYDPDVYLKFKASMIDRVAFPYASEAMQADVRSDIRKTYAHYYALRKSQDVAFEIGRLFMSMKDYPAAMRYFIDSLVDCGQHHVTHYNLGLCHHYCGLLPEALECFERALSLRPQYEEAREWRDRIQMKLGARVSQPMSS